MEVRRRKRMGEKAGGEGESWKREDGKKDEGRAADEQRGKQLRVTSSHQRTLHPALQLPPQRTSPVRRLSEAPHLWPAPQLLWPSPGVPILCPITRLSLCSTNTQGHQRPKITACLPAPHPPAMPLLHSKAPPKRCSFLPSPFSLYPPQSGFHPATPRKRLSPHFLARLP